MKRGLVIAFAVLWALVALAGIGVLVNYLNGGALGMFHVDFGMGTTVRQVKEESISAQGVKRLQVDVTYDSIELIESDRDDFHVTQYGREDIPEEAVFTAVREGDTLTISTRRYTSIRVGIFIGFNGEEKLTVEVPRGWTGSAGLVTTSGSSRLLSEFSLEDVTIEASSGSIKIERPVKAASLRMKTSSGSVKVESNADVAGAFESKSSSGSQKVIGALTAGSVRMETTSGGIRLEGPVECGGDMHLTATSGGIRLEVPVSAKNLTAGSSSGSVRIGEAKVEGRYELTSTSGSVNVAAISGSGRMKSTSGGVDARLSQPVGDVEAVSTSGGVSLVIPRELSFELEADTSSGSIRTDFEILYRSDRRNSAVATVGENPTSRLRLQATSGNVKVRYS